MVNSGLVFSANISQKNQKIKIALFSLNCTTVRKANNLADWRHGANFFTVLERSHIGCPGNAKNPQKICKIWPKWAKMAKMGQTWPKFHKSAHNSAYWRHGANFFTVLERTHIGHPGNTKKSAKNQPQIGQKRPKSAKIGQNPTKVPITRPIEDMTPSFLQFWNAHTWGP